MMIAAYRFCVLILMSSVFSLLNAEVRCVTGKDSISSSTCERLFHLGRCTETQISRSCGATCPCSSPDDTSCAGKSDLSRKSLCIRLRQQGRCDEPHIARQCAATCPCQETTTTLPTTIATTTSAFPIRCPGGSNTLEDKICDGMFHLDVCDAEQIQIQCRASCPCVVTTTTPEPETDNCFNVWSNERCEANSVACSSPFVRRSCKCTCGACDCFNTFDNKLCKRLQTLPDTTCANYELTRINCRDECALCGTPNPCININPDEVCWRLFPNPKICKDPALMNRCAKHCGICGQTLTQGNIKTMIEGDLNSVKNIIKGIKGTAEVDSIILGNANNALMLLEENQARLVNVTIRGNDNVITVCVGCKPEASRELCKQTIVEE